METYILIAICLIAWLVTLGVIKLLMRHSDMGFIVGSIVGLLMAAAAGGAYYQHLAACRTCI